MNGTEQRSHRTATATVAKRLDTFSEDVTVVTAELDKRITDVARASVQAIKDEQAARRDYVNDELRQERTHRQEVDGAIQCKLNDFVGRGLLGRLKWLFTGK